MATRYFLTTNASRRYHQAAAAIDFIPTNQHSGAKWAGVLLSTDDTVSAGLAGVAQVETATAAGSVSGDGNASVTVTAAGLAGSPLVVPVAVVNGDAAATWAGKVRTALAANAALAAAGLAVGGSTTGIALTKSDVNGLPMANDATLNIALATGTATGITAAPTSANTTAGVAALYPEISETDVTTYNSLVGVQQVETATASGTISTAGTVSVTVTGAALGVYSPRVLLVPAALNDTATQWAAKVYAALLVDAKIAAVYLPGNTTTAITLTVKQQPFSAILANDATLNIALANGTSAGVNAAASSANTTAGVAQTGHPNAPAVAALNNAQLNNPTVQLFP